MLDIHNSKMLSFELSKVKKQIFNIVAKQVPPVLKIPINKRN